MEVYLNTGSGVISEADYLGVFIFMERIKRGRNRVNVARLDPSDATEPGISGGYILKIDRGTATIPAALSRDFVPVDPEDSRLTPVNGRGLAITSRNSSPRSRGPAFPTQQSATRGIIDVPSWIDYHIMTELTYNVDEWYSQHLPIERSRRQVEAGPVLGFRSLARQHDADWWRRDNRLVLGRDHGIFRQLLGDSGGAGGGVSLVPPPLPGPEFSQRYIDRYQELRRTVLSDTNIAATVNRLAAARYESQARNFQKWPTLNTVIRPARWHSRPISSMSIISRAG